MAAESGERRAARMRELAEDHAVQADKYRRVAEALEKGNAGEHKVAALLDVLDGAGWVVLNDRYQSASSRANIDHILIGPPGVCVIDSKNWSGARVRFDHRGMAVGRYRRDDELRSAKAAAATVADKAQQVSPGVITAPILAFTQDVGLAVAVFEHDVVCLQAEQLLPWLTSVPARLTAQEVHQVASTLDAAFPPRAGARKPVTLATLDRYRAAAKPSVAPASRRADQDAAEQWGPLSYPNGWGGTSPLRSAAGRALRQAVRALLTLAVLAAALVLLLVVGVPMLQKGLTNAVPKIFPTPAASPHAVVTPPKKPTVHATPRVAPHR